MTLDLTNSSLDLSGILEANNFKCEQCSYSTNRKHNLRRHLKRHDTIQSVDLHSSTSSSITLGPSTSTPKRHSSISMGASTSTPTTNKELRCDQCFKGFKSKFGLSLHKKNKHENMFKHTCEICGKGYNQAVQFKFHRANHVNIPFKG